MAETFDSENIRLKSVAYLKDMIKIRSMSGEEKGVSQYIGTKLEQFGLQVEYQPINERSENVIAKIKGNTPGPSIIMVGHMDTVPATEGWSTDPFDPYEDGDRIYGLGASDMKAGLATILSIAEILSQHRDKLNGELSLVFVVDEEGFSTGINRFLKDNVSADVAFMVEPHFNHAIIGSVGKILIQGEVIGKACHAAHYREGINGISEAVKFISHLEKIDVFQHEQLEGQPYIPFNIKGGYDTYSVTVPDRCQFILNKHTVPGETKEYVFNQLESVCTNPDLNGHFTFQMIEPFYPAYEIDRDLEFITVLRSIYQDVTNNQLDLRYNTGVSDSNCLVGIGNIPTINFGPSGGPIHQANEWVSKNELLLTIEIYLKVLSKYLF